MVFGPAEVPDALLFVDIESGQSLADLRLVPYEIYSNVRTILVRAEGDIDQQADLLKDEGRRLCRVIDEPGVPTKLLAIDSGFPISEPISLLRRARAIELTALLSWGKAIWAPSDHHYVLPSGRHAATFIKLGHAIRGPRDAVVVARWLFPHFQEDETGLVLDTGTLAAVALALQTELHHFGRRLGRVIVLDHYPRTLIDVQQAVFRAAGDARRVVAVISVSSSGQLRDRLHGAMALPALGLQQTVLQVLIDQSSAPFSNTAPSTENIDTWTPLELGQNLADARTFDRNCEICRDAKRAPLVAINPLTFELEYLPQIKAVTPCTKDPGRNYRFWEICSESDGLALDEDPDSHAAKYRPRGKRMAIHVRWKNLLSNASFRNEVGTRLRDPRLVEHLSCNGERLVLVPSSDAARSGFDQLWDTIRHSVGSTTYHCFPNEGEWSEELKGRVNEASDILVLSLGTVSGSTLQRARNVIQSRPPQGTYDRLRALVVHARPGGTREWQTLRNSFAGRIEAMWSCIMPTRSVLTEESVLFDTIDVNQLEEDELAFFEERRALCSDGHVGGEHMLFWGARDEDRLSPHSIYGDTLRPLTTFVAVGAAMEARRHEEYSVPQRMAFDLRAITRSYYDPLIVASVLRWLQPFEQWWGTALPLEMPSGNVAAGQVERVATAVGELLWRAAPTQRRILMPELLLAYALGKIPKLEAEAAMSYAVRAVGTLGPGNERGSLRLALRLAQGGAAVPVATNHPTGEPGSGLGSSSLRKREEAEVHKTPTWKEWFSAMPIPGWLRRD